MATITKHRDPQGWRIAVNGKATTLLIVKGDAPRYREGQSYWLTNDDDTLALEGRSVGGLLSNLEMLSGILSGD